jgi:hypothetical protein
MTARPAAHPARTAEPLPGTVTVVTLLPPLSPPSSAPESPLLDEPPLGGAVVRGGSEVAVPVQASLNLSQNVAKVEAAEKIVPDSSAVSAQLLQVFA